MAKTWHVICSGTIWINHKKEKRKEGGRNAAIKTGNLTNILDANMGTVTFKYTVFLRSTTPKSRPLCGRVGIL